MKKNKDKVDLLLKELDKEQLAEFIQKECAADKQLRNRFLALGAGRLFKPDPADYADRILDLIESYTREEGYIRYRSTLHFNWDATDILAEADTAMRKEEWEIAMAVLKGVASVSDDILNSGDDSAGNLGDVVEDCFGKLHKLSENESVPESIRSELFEYALSRFIAEDLKGLDWWWDWMEIAITLADTPEKHRRVFAALDAIKPEDDDWSNRYNVKTAQKYKLEMMSRCGGSDENMVRFMYDNVSNPDFRKKLIQRAWDMSDYDEVLRLAAEGVNHDAQYAGLVSDWHKWEYLVYRQKNERDKVLPLARHFFFTEGRWADKEYSRDTMYSTLKSLIPQDEWAKYVETLISEAQGRRNDTILLYIYTREKMWKEYMEYLRNNPGLSNIDAAPQEVKELFGEEIIRLYEPAVRRHFQIASNRDSYREGVDLLRKLIKYGGKQEADRIVAEQRARTPRRPALIDELSRL